MDSVLTLSTQSTLGGPGWIPRRAAHSAEVAAGRYWTPCGYRCEASPLRAVMLARPPDSIAKVTAPNDHLMIQRPDLGRMRDQCDALAEAYRAAGVDVLLMTPPPDAPANIVFLRDLFLVTPDGAVIGRTASEQRAGEERHAAAALATAGVPLLRTVAGTGTFECADALWLHRETVLIGYGFRTNEAGLATARAVLAEQGVNVRAIPLGPGVQHLLGSVVFIDRQRVALNTAAAPDPLRSVLREYDIELVEFAPDGELTDRRGMNFVTLAPNSILMPAGCPAIRDKLEKAGVDVHVIDVSEYINAGGGVACATGILRRDD